MFAGEWSLIELAGYPGLTALLLAVVGLPAVRRDRRAAALLAVAGVSVLAALGASTPLGRVLYLVPIYNGFRGWARYIVGFDLAVAILAAYGVAFLRNATEEQRRRAMARALAGLVVMCVAGAVLPFLTPVRAFVAPAGTAVPAVMVPIVFALVGTVAAVKMARASRWAVVLILVVLLDPILSFGAFFDWRSDSPTMAMQRRDFSGPPFYGPVPDAGGGIDRYLYTGATLVNLNTVRRSPPYLLAPKAAPYINDVAGLRSVNGSDPLASEQYLEAVGGMTPLGVLTRPLSVWHPGSDVLDLLRVSLIIGDSTEGESALAAAFGASGMPVDIAPLGPWRQEFGVSPEQPGPLRRYEYQPRLPEAFLVGTVEQRDRSAVLQALEGRTPFDPLTSALVEQRCRLCDGIRQPGPAGRVGASQWDWNRVEVGIDADRPALLVVSQAWSPGWKATVDGRSAPVVRANGLVQGVPVGPGKHRVVLRYSAPGLVQGAWLTLATAGLLVMACLLDRWRRTGTSERGRPGRHRFRRSPEKPAIRT